MTVASVIWLVLAALMAGPWPELPALTLVPRLGVAIAVAFWLIRPRGLRWALLASIAFAFGLEWHMRRPPSELRLEETFQRQILKLQDELATLAQRPGLTQLLVGTGAEAKPEAPFTLFQDSLGRFPTGVDSLALLDSQGEPVAWAGSRPRLPMVWRPVGERVCLPEPWVREVVLWCREPVYESGRVVGSILAAASLPEDGARQVLGVAAGLRRVVVPKLLPTDQGPPHLTVTSRPASPPFWAASGGALVFAILAALLWAPPPLRVWLVVAACGAAILVGIVGLVYLPSVVLLALALGVRLLPAKGGFRLTLAFLAGLMAWALPPLLTELGCPSLPPSLLLPPPALLASLLGFVAFLVAVPPRPKTLPWVAAPLLLAGLWSASGLVLALGLGVLVFFLGSRHRPLWAAGAAAAVFVGGGDGVFRDLILARTEATLARWGEVKSVARALLGSLPEGRLEALAQAPPGLKGVRLGDLGTYLQLSEVLPGTALVLEDGEARVVATWGEMGLLVQGRDQELASRSLPLGFRIRLLAPPSPHHVLAALAASAVGVPVAAFDRAGSPVSRGAPFHPLPPSVVGEALARGRFWGRVAIGRRPVPTYLRAFDDWILAVPWMRPAWPDFALLWGALWLWAGAPFFFRQQSQRLKSWWQARRTFTGRLRALAFAAALVPLALLGNVLPAQWVREREEARLQMTRALASALSQSAWEEGLEKLVRDLGAVVVVYRPSFLTVTSRPDLALLGQLPLLPPPEAYVRAVRRWWEPIVVGNNSLAVFIPVKSGSQSLVFGILGVAELTGTRFRPAEWFVFTALWAVVLALAAVEGLAQRLSRPMAQLVTLAQRLGRGEAASLHGMSDASFEFATLAQAFASMAAEVQTRQEELRRQRDLLQRVLENLSAAVMVVEGSQVVLANGAARNLYQGEGIDGFVRLFGPQLAQLLANAREGERVSGKVVPSGQADALWNLTAVPLVGEGERVLVVLEDLSDVARAERLASLNELARIVAHEVKNPLTPIRLWVEELEAALGRSPQQVVEVARLVVSEVLQQVARLREVAQGFSNLVALEEWEPSQFDLGAVAGEVVAEYKVLERRGIRIALQRAPSPLVVYADLSWVKRALRHLLENSTRALGSGGGTITVVASMEQNWAVLAVRDTAGGVAVEHLPRLFEPHFSPTGSGSGLGLAVVRRVCQKAGGWAEARNLQEGLEVRMFFPPAS